MITTKKSIEDHSFRLLFGLSTAASIIIGLTAVFISLFKLKPKVFIYFSLFSYIFENNKIKINKK